MMTPRLSPTPYKSLMAISLPSMGCYRGPLASILLFTPYFFRIIMQIHLQPQEFITGLAIFCCMPTMLSRGSSYPGVALSFEARVAFSQEIANHSLQLYRMDTLASQRKFKEWWKIKFGG